MIGIIASRVKDLTHKPTIVFTDESNGMLKGSGRSIKGIHLRDVLALIQSKHDIIPKFGGHAMAAGLSIRKEDLSCFTEAFQDIVAQCDDDCFTESVYSDGSLSPKELNLSSAQAIRDYGIWGQNYPEPLFDNLFTIKQKRLIKDKHLKLDLLLDDALLVSSMWFYS